MYIYVDESGDLGFGEKSSNYFIIAFVIVNYHEIIIKKVKRLLKNINTHSNSHIIEFKFSADRDVIRNKFLNLISKLDLDICTIIIKKSAIKPYIREKKSILYNHIVVEYVTKTVLFHYNDINHIELHLDLSMSKNSRDHFNEYFSYKIKGVIKDQRINNNITNNVFHDYSQNEPCIQIADYVAGSLRQSYEYNNNHYYEIIKDKILHVDKWGIDEYTR